MKKIFILCLSLTLVNAISRAEEYFVNPQSGCDQNSGTIEQPFRSIDHAVNKANKLTGEGAVNIKLMSGVYVLNDKVCINPLRSFNDSVKFTIEAAIMPSDTSWTAIDMPVIQSVSGNNSISYFPHSSGLYLASDHIVIQGIKFLGNTNSEVQYYYPVNREDASLSGLEIAHCMFIGERHSAPIQGGVWVLGQDVDIHNCIFNECRNAILVFSNKANTHISHNIITDAYESAFWIEANGESFHFSNNVISRCHYFWTNCTDEKYTFSIENSIITGNAHYTGKWNGEKFALEPDDREIFTETRVIKAGEIVQVVRTGAELPDDYLHLIPDSMGSKLETGILK